MQTIAQGPIQEELSKPTTDLEKYLTQKVERDARQVEERVWKWKWREIRPSDCEGHMDEDGGFGAPLFGETDEPVEMDLVEPLDGGLDFLATDE